MRTLAFLWPTDGKEQLMINNRRDLICPAIDGISNELLSLGVQVIYVNLAAEEYNFPEEELKVPAFILGLPLYRWKNIKNKKFDLIWHAIKDPTPSKVKKHIKNIMKQLDPFIPILNPVSQIKKHTKKKYI